MNTINAISNQDDIIDSREIIERIEELKELIEGEGLRAYRSMLPSKYFEDTCAEYRKELNALEALAKEAGDYSSDWIHGEQLIRRSHFVDYIAELISDCYELPKELTSGSWPYRHITIDYEAAADEAEHDYTSVDFDGVEYLIRSC
jgi:hypothetical protein